MITDTAPRPAAPADLPDVDGRGKARDLIALDERNFETPPETLSDYLTPAPRFFVRSNHAFPTIHADSWRLHVGGMVERECTLTMGALRALPQRTLTAWMECYGNGRARFAPHAPGNQWSGGAVGNATWHGVPLASVLELAGVRPGAVEVVCQGGDDAAFQRGLPLAKALEPDTLLAWEMNGAPLLPVHGYPLRLVVPGWGGIASVKWLVGLTLIDRPFDGPYNTVSYVLFDPDGTNRGPVREQPVKSLITSLSPHQEVPRGIQAVTGFAWSGAGEIARVEFSADGGETWDAAEILRQDGPRAWAQFAYRWEAQPGDAALTSRATDAAGAIQPRTPRWNRNGYQYNGWHVIPVRVV